MTKGRYENLRTIENERNLGFAEGMNQGIRESSGQYVLLLNADVFISRSFIEEALSAAERCGNARVGMIGSKAYRLIDGKRTTTVDNAGFFLRKRIAHVNTDRPDDVHFVFGPPGCCPFLRRDMLEDARLSPGEYFDAEYFSQFEDLDLWFRAQLRGWRCLYTPRAVAWHMKSASYGGRIRFFERPAFFQRHFLKNRYVTILKDLPLELVLWLFPYLVVAELATLALLMVRAPRSLPNVFNAWIYLVKNLKKICRKRNSIQGGRVVTCSYLKELFVGF